MQLQYLSDGAGVTTGVQIQMPMEEWLHFKAKYKEFESEESEMPAWQIDLGKKERRLVENGTAELIDWGITKKELGL